jgi:hypothetical protein
MHRIAIGFGTVLMAIALQVTPAMADDNPCSGQAPGPPLPANGLRDRVGEADRQQHRSRP